MLLGPNELITDGIYLDVDLAAACRVVPKRHEAATIVIAGKVQDDRSQVGRRPVDCIDLSGMSSQAKECLLDDVLRGITIVDEEASQTNQRATLGTKQPKHQFLGVHADRLGVQPRRDGRP